MPPGHNPEEEIAAGVDKLAALGLEHLADVQVNFGGVCVGGLAQMFGREDHAGRTDVMLDQAAQVAEAGGSVGDVEEKLLEPIAFFVDKDPKNGEYVRVTGEAQGLIMAVRAERAEREAQGQPSLAGAKKK